MIYYKGLMMFEFAKRIAGQGTSIFTTMSKLAVEHKAVNLGQGFPDFDGPDWLKEEAFKAMKEGKNQYAPMPGIFSLRKAISEMHLHFYGLTHNPETEITITAGATEALYSTITALINEGDEVILFEPVYDSYLADVQLAGGIPKFVTLKKPEFDFDFIELESEITDKTKLIILNNPHNPTGKVFSENELQFIAGMAEKYNLLVISDEVYEFLTYQNQKHIPFASFPGMKERTITISSTGKTFSMTGWKIGWAIACPEITNAIRKVHQWTAFAVNTPGQHAMAAALTRLDEYLPDFRKMYSEKKDLIFNLCLETKFKPHQCFGSYFLMVDLPEGETKNDVDCAIDLVTNFGVATIPPSVFYGKSEEGSRMLRLCFAKNNDTILSGISNLKNY